MNLELPSVVLGQKMMEHSPPFDIFKGVQYPSYDRSTRIQSILQSIEELRGDSTLDIIHRSIFSTDLIGRVHDTDYIEFLYKTSERLKQAPPIRVPVIDKKDKTKASVIEVPAFEYPTVFPHGITARSQNAVSNQGVYSFDTETPIMGNTYEVALDAAMTSLTGADMLLHGKRNVYVLTRPSGHHAEHGRMGGYCYFNNAAIASQYLYDKTSSQIAILDIDAHHGNGTQDIFYNTRNVYYVSIHSDPSQSAPYFSGFEDEIGAGLGLGANKNISLSLGSGEKEFFPALDIAIGEIRQQTPKFLVVSFGSDGHQQDPVGLFTLETKSYKHIAKRIASLNIPILSVQEGGYGPAVGENVVSYLQGFSSKI